MNNNEQIQRKRAEIYRNAIFGNPCYSFGVFCTGKKFIERTAMMFWYQIVNQVSRPRVLRKPCEPPVSGETVNPNVLAQWRAADLPAKRPSEAWGWAVKRSSISGKPRSRQKLGEMCPEDMPPWA